VTHPAKNPTVKSSSPVVEGQELAPSENFFTASGSSPTGNVAAAPKSRRAPTTDFFQKDPMSASQAARYLGVSKKTLLRYCRDHLITYLRYPGGDFKFRKVALDLFLTQHTISVPNRVSKSAQAAA
jgi:excisionase family DNA binding protein